MDSSAKFNNEDRSLIIREIEKIQGVKLESIASSKKLYKSNKEQLYLIQGGRELWHGINKQIVEKLGSSEFKTRENVLIIAKKYSTQLDIYVGSLLIFVQNIDKLVKTKSGGLQFHCQQTEDGLFIEEIPNLICNWSFPPLLHPL